MNAQRLSDSDTVPATGFDAFFTEAWPGTFRLAAMLTHSTSAGEDIAQEALAQVSKRWESLDNPRAYLRTAVIHASYNWNRHHRIAREKLPLLLAADRSEFHFAELADAIARLPYRQRTVVVLRYYADLSEAEIAAALGCRPGTVKSLASRALATLSKEMPR